MAPASDLTVPLSLLDLTMSQKMVTKTYPFDEIQQGYRDMHDGKNIRSVITFS